MILHSSRFDRLSESELDTVLEAIEEESREGSLSPPLVKLATTDQNKVPFEWERIYHEGGGEEGRRDLLMEQLVTLSERQNTEADGDRGSAKGLGLLKIGNSGSNGVDVGNERNIIRQTGMNDNDSTSGFVWFGRVFIMFLCT